MFRIISERGLHELRNAAATHERNGVILNERLQSARVERDLWKEQAAKWEARASRLIDQIGLADGRLSAPAMNPPAPPAPSPAQGIFRALNVDSLSRPSSEPAPLSALSILGVSEEAAAKAVADLKSRS